MHTGTYRYRYSTAGCHSIEPAHGWHSAINPLQGEPHLVTVKDMPDEAFRRLLGVGADSSASRTLPPASDRRSFLKGKVGLDGNAPAPSDAQTESVEDLPTRVDNLPLYHDMNESEMKGIEEGDSGAGASNTEEDPIQVGRCTNTKRTLQVNNDPIPLRASRKLDIAFPGGGISVGGGS